ncbi:NADH-quinone oxidoreductase subunit NuoI [Flavobacterium columnare NBRC 100251 = ATCC 23463]|uniref:NADH-quinone oxidoreductase subunit I n=3 Tax=Flavobacterium TaxID=237 RepID=G8X6I9_FLACA|nr:MULTISPECIES: NADH-quinone oxidoreductase subunit NuoI [Flavobacterium]AEW84881.1 NADH-quinone oxidoreductase, chain I [Flavobacterium columnare ATCC 49512]AMA48248.1 NADH-quinone oxidoreductase subunit I [Flavobacterium covae]AMO20180.1 NADH-quinone oxidoreductase subunit NuoI [Flavobacterium columnare]AND63587.1 NADH-quinone oxidoreductase subunit I [Flavobacterium covae]AUX18131.1 NADH-quinone oxidoreductase subunit I [Flavobacterium columnare]
MSIETISLSGRKKEVSNKKMTFWESLYLVAIVKGLFTTIRHLFKRKVTIKYPEQVRPFSPVYRGQHMLKRDEQGRENCTACGMCAVACPAEAITMTAAERKKGEEHLYREEKYASTYEINMLRCIFCGLCEEACPKDAIYLTESKVIVKSASNREDFIYGKDKLVMPLDMAIKNSKTN